MLFEISDLEIKLLFYLCQSVVEHYEATVNFTTVTEAELSAWCGG